MQVASPRSNIKRVGAGHEREGNWPLQCLLVPPVKTQSFTALALFPASPYLYVRIYVHINVYIEIILFHVGLFTSFDGVLVTGILPLVRSSPAARKIRGH